ncbi:RbsD/FucU family protein [Amnibacterium flavum]|uniref:Fucose-binding protein n=1 Tax=Amnibacterium flavum TaxID=2173173 RepID=A0A2V1HU14_9MICO|nr:RbsD/FucU domain-containing protein [Amnibacterium flavum]PVZ95801.1 fucose-binding protein [Amnibacterium flavum]
MLKGIDPILNGELLKILDEMGHGDDIVLVDRNFPAHSGGNPVVNLGDISTTRAAQAVLSVFPLDTFVEQPVGRMEVRDDASIVLDSHDEVLAVAQADFESHLEFEVVPRFDFYARARAAYAVILTLDPRPYSCFSFKKGVI